MIRVGVLGAGGRMGREVCRAVDGDGELELVAAVDPAFKSRALVDIAGVSDLNIAAENKALTDAGAEVAVDFTEASTAAENIRWCIANGINSVVGTTGLSAEQLQAIEKLLELQDGKPGVFIAPNFAIGAVLMMRFAEQAAKYLPEAEIIELHHTGKKDAPSGTALSTAEKISRGRTQAASSASVSDETLPGSRGGEKDGVRVHSVRLPGLVAHQEVIFGGPGQTLTIRHDSTDRTSFMPGVLLAIKVVGTLTGLTVGLEQLLD